jgi:hypothetical protein
MKADLTPCMFACPHTAKFVVDVKAFTQTEQPMACLNLMINFLVPDQPPK